MTYFNFDICYLMGSKVIKNIKQEIEQQIADHYCHRQIDLETRLLEAVQALGKKPEELTPKDIAAVDVFHIRKS